MSSSSRGCVADGEMGEAGDSLMRPDCQNRAVKLGRALVGLLLVVALAAVLALVAGDELLGGTTGPGDSAPAIGPAPGSDTGSDAESAHGSNATPLAPTPAVPADAGEAWVEYVHDGDTLFLSDGRKVRLLGIDTPEVGERAECGGEEARARLREHLPEGTRVRTVADVQPLDRYDRSLLFLFTDDGTLVNLELIRDGFAEAVVLPPNVLWSAELEAAEDEAQAAGRGIWGSC